MSDVAEVLAALPSSGMNPVSPAHATELLQLCTVMGWKPKLPLHIMRDDMAKRWFLKGTPGAQDYWIRDSDMDMLKKTPMWKAVASATPYGTVNMPEAVAKARKDARENIMIIIDDPLNDDDPVEQERKELAKARLEAEERLRRMDDWE